MLDVHGDWEGCAAVNFYNDIDSKACAWTRALIDQGSIPPGDARSHCNTVLFRSTGTFLRRIGMAPLMVFASVDSSRAM